MALTWDRMCEYAGGACFFEVQWDSWQEQEDGTRLDPTATGRVERVRFQNLTNVPHSVKYGSPSRTETAQPGTPLTEIGLPGGPNRPVMGTPYQCW